MSTTNKKKEVLTYSFLFLSSCFSFAFPLFPVLLIKITQLNPNICFLAQSFVYLASGFLQIQIGKKIDSGNYGYVVKLFLIFSLSGLFFVIFSYLNSLLLIISLVNFIVCITTATTTYYRLIIASVKEDKARTNGAVITFIADNVGLSLSAVLAYFFLAYNTKILIAFDILSTSMLFFGVLFIYNFLFFKTKLNLDEKIVKHEKICANNNEFTRKKISYKHITLISVAYILIMATVCSKLSAFPALFIHLSIPIDKAVPIALLSNAIAIVFFSLFFRKHIANNSKLILFLGIFATAFGHAVLPLCKSLSSIFVCIFIISIGESVILPIIISKYYKTIHRYDYQEGVATGTLFFIRRIGMVISPLLALPLSYINSSYYFSIIFFILPIIGLLFIELNDINLKKAGLKYGHI